MIVKNYLEAEYKMGPSHKGVGEIKNVQLYKNEDFMTKLKFLNYAELPPHTSIGYHRHRQDEEIYVILEGRGRMTVNEEVREVRQGDVLINRPEWAHSLENHTDEVLKVLVFEVDL